ncbi:TPA: hypothetical protein ACYHJK_004030, partial [Pseudomonas aeruginosa]
DISIWLDRELLFGRNILASHNVYYVKLDAMSEMFMSLVSLRLREFETIWLGSRFLARLW